MVADYMPHSPPREKGNVFKYGDERDKALKAKRSKPVAIATGHESFGSRNPDGSQYAPPPRKSKTVRPS